MKQPYAMTKTHHDSITKKTLIQAKNAAFNNSGRY